MGRSTTDSQHSFATLPSANIQRSSFNRSHGVKTTFDAGGLYPVLCDELVPGDTYNCRLTSFARLATPIHPIMDNMYLDTFFFAVPLRLLWGNFQRFMGEQNNPDDDTDFVIPIVDSDTGFVEGDLYDYFGLPTQVANLEVSALYGRAYNLIWNEWFRSEDLQNKQIVNSLDGPDQNSWYTVQNRGKRHDYFTSSLPWPQKGDAVLLPLGTSAPVVATGDGIPLFETNGTGAHWLGSDGVTNQVFWDQVATVGSAAWQDTKLEADLTSATAATVNEIREAFQVQRLLERDARGGTRYTELVRSHFGVVSPDARLNRPEYLGGSSQGINITQVPQTSATEAGSSQGELAGYGIAAGPSGAFTYSATEHCIIIGLISVRADLNYQQGIPKQFSRSTRFDFYWPAFQSLGEQAVLNKELFADGTAEDDNVFGYQERWAEMRYKQGMCTAAMRSNAATSLDLWHLAQDFASLPVLDDTFIQEDPPVDRIIAVPTEPHFIYDGFFQLTHVRPMPTYSIPGMIDHF